MSRLTCTLLAVFAAASMLLAAAAQATTITILNGDNPGEGFNDPTPALPVGGNPGLTVGDQRLYVFQYAANIWAATLQSAVQIRVIARFNPLSCTANAGVLGSAGPKVIFRDFGSAPFAGTWYHAALADRLEGVDNQPDSADINAQFNSSVGGATCLTVGWYYGVDGNEGFKIELLPVVIHELGHGLGFSTTTSGASGSYLSGFPSAFDHFLYHTPLGLHWDQMSAAQRVASAISCTNLVWDGTYAKAFAPGILGPPALLTITSPPVIAGDYVIGSAAFGSAVTSTPVSGSIVMVVDNTAPTGDGCETIVNNLHGRIALIDRGVCGFTNKTKAAQDSGAIAVIIVDNAAGCPPPGLGGGDPTITIPTVSVTQSDGNLIKAQLGGGVTGTLVVNPARKAGLDSNGRPKMYAPNPFASGSSVSHWDVSMEPNTLMEPAINSNLSKGTDMTPQLMRDIGWWPGVAAVDPGQYRPGLQALSPSTPNPTRSSTRITYYLAHNEPVSLAIFDLSGRLVRQLVQGAMSFGDHTAQWDGRDASGRVVAAGVYKYRLKTPTISESRSMVVVR